jgi:glycosyltransferase involved in cell wall biosynthesis
MRVLVTTDAVGGVWQYSLDLAAGLAGRGTAVTLAVLGPPPVAAQREHANRVSGLDIVTTGLTLDWLAADEREIEEASVAVAEITRQVGADVVHLNTPALAAHTHYDMPAVAAAHSCVKTWWAAVHGGALPDDFAWRAALTGRGLAAADAILTPSASFARALVEAYGLQRDPSVVHNGRSSVTARAAAPPPSPFAFTAGRLWDDGKNIATLERAAARLSIPVLAAGPLVGPNGAAVRLECIKALGSLDDAAVAGWLAARPIFVSAALYEPFGLAVLEAARAGCPLVLSDIPTFRELWADAAIFVDARDDAAFAAAITRIAEDRGLRETLGRAARERSRRYTAERMVDGTVALYLRALAADAPALRQAAVA